MQAALSSAEGANVSALCDGLFACAEAFSFDGRKAAAVAIYDFLRDLPQAPEEVRAAALRGAVLLRGNEGLVLLAEALRSDDDVAADAAARTALELKDPGVVPLVAAELHTLPPHRQVLFAGVLGKLGDTGALPALLELAKEGEPPVRLATVTAAAEVGGTDTVAALVELTRDPDSTVAETAIECLAGLRGAEADEAVVSLLAAPDQILRVKMVELVARRRILQAKPAVAGLMRDPDDALRLAAVKGYGQLATSADLPVLLDTIVTSSQPSDIAALGKAIVAACRNGGEQKACVPQIAETLERATDAARPTLVKVLNRVGGP